MSFVARQIVGELERLVCLYHAAAKDEVRRTVIKEGCEYRLKQLWREGDHGLALHWENRIYGLNGHCEVER
jgi:hypothetical protein